MEPTDAEELLWRQEGVIVRITLNRPHVLNALSLGMLDFLSRLMVPVGDAPDVHALIVEGAGDRAFSAGGDVRAVWEARRNGFDALKDRLYRVEYTLNWRVHRFGKPYVALMDGITMGGGCGISVHGSHRVVTERTILAMPETGLGFFPDVGASWFLPRCPGRLGYYLGLTGASVAAADAIYCGLADAYVPSVELPALVAALADGADPDTALARFAADPGPPPLAAARPVIDRCFAAATAQGILDALAHEPGTFAGETLARLRTLPPFSLAVTLKALHAGAEMGIDDCLTQDFRACLYFMGGAGDFFEGVRATFIDKDGAPKWRHASLAEVNPADVDACFASLGAKDLTFPSCVSPAPWRR